MENTIKSTWLNWANDDQCPLCKRTGKNIAMHYKKGHRRNNGIILEWGLSYCEDCASTEACEEHWKQAWNEKWKECEDYAEVQYQKWGVYSAVGSVFGQPSRFFGYAKTE